MEYVVCKNCVMDSTAKEFTPTETGCNFCDGATKALQEIKEERKRFPENFRELNNDVKKSRAKGKYDCLIGLSGGVDSSYLLHKAVEWGFKPLCFSVDNGWNDPKADENIMRLVETLKVPFYRYTIDLKKFKDLQASFITAGQRNLEIPTDHILMATTYDMANKYGIKWILSGGNVATESIMPASWGYNARDLVHIKDVYGKSLKGLPTLSLLKWNYYRWVKKIKIFYLLDHLDYNREEAIKILSDKYGYISYGDKHCESEFTKWFQNFYLYEKFGIDKRKAHYSSLIVSGQMTRKEAMERLNETLYYPKLGIENRVLKYKEKTGFKTDNYNLIAKLIKIFR